MWIKICGVKEIEAANQVARSGASAIGLNFFAKSKRSTNLKQAREIATAVRGQLELVGLFVNHSPAEVVEHARQLQLDWIQLHGDEPPAYLAGLQSELVLDLPSIKLMKAFRVGPQGLDEVANYLDECRQAGVKLSACLIDAAVQGEFGGTGHVAPWDLVRDQYDRTNWPPLVLAGGLTSANVRAATAAVDPWGIDTASGVESSPGVKDARMINEFVNAIRQ
ncbi:N-(5'-phosphoribosyl)anthranilate isomerase [Polystyrenella longa]|uniref:N-(5'-phosphoribosyl)anthranilate isomerase n=1 Tax=Polystyrenella longa TaxID=2528007 RepID=A0A518CU96_9PLAN|nr:phosphoribosylanthranilate isomerase [Polystyrenella longa]QDU82809.1 N-(5'-phosphoribosyl)anthranilate isomerase [Polystyrenella longa]